MNQLPFQNSSLEILCCNRLSQTDYATSFYFTNVKWSKEIMNLGKALVKAHYITLKYSLKISEPKILPFLDYTFVVFACLHF